MTHAPPFPLDRAFVVQLRGDAALPASVRGRVEHLASGRAGRFESVAELLSFVERTLDACRDAAPRATHAKEDE